MPHLHPTFQAHPTTQHRQTTMMGDQKTAHHAYFQQVSKNLPIPKKL
jgi:hypothetical protein